MNIINLLLNIIINIINNHHHLCSIIITEVALVIQPLYSVRRRYLSFAPLPLSMPILESLGAEHGENHLSVLYRIQLHTLLGFNCFLKY